MVMRRALIVIGVGAVLLVGAGPASATYPGSNGRIAFLSTDIHTIRPDGTDDQSIAKGLGGTWSADGKQFLFSRFVGPEQTAIFTMHADGSDQRRLTHSQFSEGGAHYSPNGRRIVFGRITSHAGRSVILSAHSDGSNERVLARGVVGLGEYSPSGKRILYTNSANGVAIWDMRPDGSDKRRLVPPQAGGYGPDYSPDGKHIVFDRLGQLWVMRADGSHLHQLDCGRAASSPQFSPNGRKLVWVGSIGHGRGASSDIFTSTLRCSDPFRVTHYGAAHGGGASTPSWQPRA